MSYIWSKSWKCIIFFDSVPTYVCTLWMVKSSSSSLKLRKKTCIVFWLIILFAKLNCPLGQNHSLHRMKMVMKNAWIKMIPFKIKRGFHFMLIYFCYKYLLVVYFSHIHRNYNIIYKYVHTLIIGYLAKITKSLVQLYVLIGKKCPKDTGNKFIKIWSSENHIAFFRKL